MLRSQLAAYSEREVIGEASTAQEAVDLADKLRPEVVVVDIDLDEEPTGIQAGLTIK